MEFPHVIQTGLVSLGVVGIGAGVRKLWTLNTTVVEIKTTLSDHIASEDKTHQDIANKIEAVSKKLPNGNLEAILSKLADMEARVLGCPRPDPYPYRQGASADRRKR